MYCRHFFGCRFIPVWTVLGSTHLSGHTEVLVSDDQGHFSSGGGERSRVLLIYNILNPHNTMLSRSKLATNLQTE